MRCKKGLSAIVTTLIILLLVLVAVGIVWVVIGGIIERGAEQISIDQFTIDLEVEGISRASGDGISVLVKRKVGTGDFDGISFVIDDGRGSNVIINEMDVDLSELQTKTYNLNYVGNIEEISVAPIFVADSGKEQVAEIIDSRKFSDNEVKEATGLVSYWMLDDSAEDSVGENDGINNGVVFVDGKVGEGGEFDETDNIEIPNSGINLAYDERTISVWFNVNDKGLMTEQTIYEEGGPNKGLNIYIKDGSVYVGAWNKVSGDGRDVWAGEWISSSDIEDNKWHHVVLWLNGSSTISPDSFRAYLDGVLIESADGTNIEEHAGNTNLGMNGNTFFDDGKDISEGEYFAGLIDEVRIYDRALSEAEISAMYELDR